MPVPDFQSIMLPLLRLAADGKEHFVRDAVEALASHFGLSDADRQLMLPSGRARLFDNRFAWAKTHLTKTLLLQATRRGYFKITERGFNALRDAPDKVDLHFLNRFPELKQFRAANRPTLQHPEPQPETQGTPDELLEAAYQSLRDSLANDLLDLIKKGPPSLLEKVVVELLISMGYGGSRKDAGQAIGKAGDEGVDGIIKEDRLGLDIIYIQAKKWDNTVGRPEIQRFAGALQGQKARKGIFITTSDFSRDAREYTAHLELKIVLIDGDQLAQMMIDNDIGVASVSQYSVKKIDSDYFSEA